MDVHTESNSHIFKFSFKKHKYLNKNFEHSKALYINNKIKLKLNNIDCCFGDHLFALIINFETFKKSKIILKLRIISHFKAH